MSPPSHTNEAHRALVQIGMWLRETGYTMVAPTPETHRRVNARAANALATDARGVFGWSRPFEPSLLPAPIVELLHMAGAVDAAGTLLRSRVRFATLEDQLFLHSAYPTLDDRSVFFGPDTSRFVGFVARAIELIERTARRDAPRSARLVDIGCGSGAGGLLAARRLGSSIEETVLADVNPRALAYAAVNAELAGTKASFVESDVLAGVRGTFDLVLANPPYLVDDAARAYRHGGAQHGTELSLRIAKESLGRLAPGGSLLLYTGAPVVDGIDVFRAAVEPLVAAHDCTFRYVELDPDVFGEELERPSYETVERIAAIGLVAQRPTGAPQQGQP